MFRGLKEEQLIALAIYGIKTGAVSLQLKTGHPRAAEIVEIVNDFSRVVEKNRELADCVDRARACFG